MTADPGLELTAALEDYIETIYELIRDKGIARVRDIARARNVKAGSVSPAMKRLADLGLVRYERREFIELTPRGEAEARRVYARHEMLTRFFREVLLVPADVAREDACRIEHTLSDTTLDRLVRMFEFMRACPDGGNEFIHRFHECPLVRKDAPDCGHRCQADHMTGPATEERMSSIFDMEPGQRARVARVDASGAIRQRLLDMGIIPDAMVEFERSAPVGDPVWIKLQGFQMSLRRTEAEAILVRAV